MKCECGNEDLIKDYKTDETYCPVCGLVLSEPSNDLSMEYKYPFNYSEARSGVHLRWITNDMKGKIDSHKITSYTHNLTDDELMKKGHKGRLRN